MRVLNVRIGFATNSSSTHSIVLMPKAKPYETTERYDFGWGRFTAADADSKMNWLSVALRKALPRDLPNSLADRLIDITLGTHTYGRERADTPAVDHQSVLVLPRKLAGSPWGQTELSVEFLDDLKDFLLRPDVLILGGNDTHPEKQHKLLSTKGLQKFTYLPMDDSNKGLFCRKERDKVWTLFWRANGCRWTIDFSDIENSTYRSNQYDETAIKARDFGKLRSPLLVDLKITDYCVYGCEYCYQGSTPAGAHADEYKVYHIITALLAAEVFEVAIGGGEPTTHPKFTEILKSFHDAGITANFSTRNLKIFEVDTFLKIAPYVGGIAFSVDNQTSALQFWQATDKLHDALAPLKQAHHLYNLRLNLQVVLGSMPFDDLLAMLSDKAPDDYRAGRRITLLGWKTTQRGSIGPTYAVPENWLEQITALETRWYIGVDTQIAQTYPDQLEKCDVGGFLYTTSEGEQSMYIDAVESLAAPSSYCEEDKYVPLRDENHCIDITKLFEKF
jgi:hypothetical protein